MTNGKGQMNLKELQIQGLLDRFLQAKNLNNGIEISSEHLDDDTISAFVEGNLSESEAKPITTHLVDCLFCRHITAELIKLDFAFAGDTQTIALNNNEPTKVADVLSGILSRIFGSNDEAVFAHQETNEKTSAESEKNEE
jgi:hypothetical protein